MKSEKYTRVNYIESPGNSAGIIFLNQSNTTFNNINIYCTFEYLDAYADADHYIYGARRGTDNSEFSLNTRTNENTNGVMKCNSAGIDAHLTEGKHDITIEGSVYNIDGSEYPFTRNSSLSWNYGFELFGCRQISSNIGYAHARIYSFKVIRSNSLWINCIPVVRNSDGKCGFFDTVKDIFYTNTGLTWG